MKIARNNKYLLIVVLVLFGFQGCKRDPVPKGTLKKQKFIEVLYDVHLAEAIYSDRFRYKMDTLNTDALYKSVLEKHNVTEEEMKTTVLYYSRHPKEYDKIYSEVLSMVSQYTDELNKKGQVIVK